MPKNRRHQPSLPRTAVRASVGSSAMTDKFQGAKAKLRGTGDAAE